MKCSSCDHFETLTNASSQLSITVDGFDNIVDSLKQYFAAESVINEIECDKCKFIVSPTKKIIFK